MKYRAKHVAEYIALRFLAGLIRILPERVALAVGWALAWMAFHIFRFRVAEAQRRIREVFGDAKYSPREVRRIAWRSMRNTLFNAIEVIRMSKVNRSWVERHIPPEDVEAGTTTLNSVPGAIFVVPHMGNWDLAGVAAHQCGFPLFFIVGRQSNPLTDAYMNRMRSITGIETIARDSGTLRKVIRNLRAGKILAFMTDLRSKTPAVRVRFLGGDANVVGGMALFARQAGVPIVPVVVTREGWTMHRWRVHDPIHADAGSDKAADAQRMTQAVMDIFTHAVYEAPDQYFWYNKRWVLDPLETHPAPSSTPASSRQARPAVCS